MSKASWQTCLLGSIMAGTVCLTCTAAACDCARISIAERACGTDLAFEGEVSWSWNKSFIPIMDLSEFHFTEFRNIVALKRAPAETVRVKHKLQSSARGVTYSAGERVTVYATQAEGAYTTNSCANGETVTQQVEELHRALVLTDLPFESHENCLEAVLRRSITDQVAEPGNEPKLQ